MATDLRASASLILAGLVAEGETDDRPHLPPRPRLRKHRGEAVGAGREDPARRLSRCSRNKKPRNAGLSFESVLSASTSAAGPSRPCRPCAAGCAPAPAGHRRPRRSVCLLPSVRDTLVACCGLPPTVIVFLAGDLVAHLLGAAVVDHAVVQRLAGGDVARDRQVDQHRVEVAGLQRRPGRCDRA